MITSISAPSRFSRSVQAALQLLVVTLCSTVTALNADSGNPHTRVIASSRLKVEIGKHLERSRVIEIRLLTGEVIAGAGVVFRNGVMDVFADTSKKHLMRVVPLSNLQEVSYTRGSRSDAIIGGTLGTLGGSSRRRRCGVCSRFRRIR